MAFFTSDNSGIALAISLFDSAGVKEKSISIIRIPFLFIINVVALINKSICFVTLHSSVIAAYESWRRDLPVTGAFTMPSIR